MDYARFIKPIALPQDFVPPTKLTFEAFVAKAMGREHLHADVAGINASLDLIARTRGGGWPTGPVTNEENFTDLVWHECEFLERRSFSYVVYHSEGEYLGCCYFYPLGTRTPLSDELVAHDVDVSWWVTTSAHERGYYRETIPRAQTVGHE